MEMKVLNLILELNGERVPCFIDNGDNCEWITAIAILDPSDRSIKFVDNHQVIDRVKVDTIKEIDIVRTNQILNGALQYIISLEIKTK